MLDAAERVNKWRLFHGELFFPDQFSMRRSKLTNELLGYNSASASVVGFFMGNVRAREQSLSLYPPFLGSRPQSGIGRCSNTGLSI